MEEQHDERYVHPDPLAVPRAHASSCVKNPAQSQHAGRFKTAGTLIVVVGTILPEQVRRNWEAGI